MTNSAIVISDSVITIDMSPMVGYSMSLRIEKPDSCKPLSWTSWSQAEQVCTGGFLEDPGVPVQALLDAGVFSNTPAKILELAADVPALQYPMLQAMLKTTAAVELAQSNPLLFILLVDYDRRIVQLESLYGDYPAAPVPDTECIRALTSWADLVHEGKAMRHCVVSRHSEIAKGRQFIYRVWGKQRLTLALAYNGDDWRVYEVRGFANCDPVQEDMDMIQRWLTEHNHGAGVTARAVS